MCGIGGIVRWGGVGAGPWEASLHAMSQALAHRGPDGHGVWIDRTATGVEVALVHRRLAIIDLPGGNQPMANEDGKVQVVFNGEIYNHKELRAQLQTLGHHFQTDHSDTEVLVHGWEQWEKDLPAKLLGMFAFAIWDGRAVGGGNATNADGAPGRLFLCRDRMGQKPLFYATLPEASDRPGIVFGSTVGSVLACPQVPRRLARQQLALYLMLGYLPPTDGAAGASGTIYADIHQLPPGHFLLMHLTDHRTLIETHRYWHPSPSPHSPDPEAIPHLIDLLRDSVSSQLMADVPLVCFLSGGIDSSIIALLMQQASQKAGGNPIKTVSVGFSEDQFDESAYAQLVARHIQSDHTRLHLGPDPDILATLRHLVTHVLGQPFADSSILPTYRLSQAVRAMAPVALSGDGGDELFGGYDRYRGLAVLQRWHPLIRRLPPALSKRERYRRLCSAARGRDLADRYTRLVSLFLPEDLATLGLDAPAYHPPIPPRADAPRYAMLRDQLDYLPGDVLCKVDSAAMACALEVRAPFLDHRVVEFANRLPTSALIQGRTGKRLLRQAFRDHLPEPILARRKQGFGVPIGTWMRTQLAGPLRDLLLARNSFCQTHLNPAAVEHLLDQHQRRQRDHTHRLFALLTLELWFETNRSIAIC